ncbi:glycosyl hydrolase 108 family protein [Sphingomonas montanisoli]|nr:glycosyl hydrolase 108 family protein [Sphingomonas montanisoli]
MKPALFIRNFIETHEGKLSLDPDDTGNWFYEKGRPAVLVGSKFGVTGAALAKFRGVKRITPGQMRDLTIEEAVNVGLKLYYDEPDIDLLPWNQVTASIMDMLWGAGPGQGAKLMQRMIGVNPDGNIGQLTAAAYDQFLKAHGLEKAAVMWAEVRNAFYERIIASRPTNAKYRRGWRNRTASFLPGTTWWKSWGARA